VGAILGFAFLLWKLGAGAETAGPIFLCGENKEKAPRMKRFQEVAGPWGQKEAGFRGER
jgi:hypothetical protein